MIKYVPWRRGNNRGIPALRFRLLTVLAALAAWALVAVGGVVRVTESGLGCPHWPLCTSRAIPLADKHSVIEYSHRALVALVSVLAVAVAVGAWRGYRARRDLVVPALAAVCLVPLQALLGAVAVWLELPGWVVAFHFVVGMAFLATLVFTAAAAWRRAPTVATPAFARLSLAGALAGFAVVSVGAAVVATDSAHACGKDWPACNGGFATGGAHAELQVSHRMLAYTVAALALALFLLALRGSGPRLVGSLPLLASLVQIGLGVAIVVAAGEGRAHESLAGLHVAGAGAVWASVVALAAHILPGRATAEARLVSIPVPSS